MSYEVIQSEDVWTFWTNHSSIPNVWLILGKIIGWFPLNYHIHLNRLWPPPLKAMFGSWDKQVPCCSQVQNCTYSCRYGPLNCIYCALINCPFFITRRRCRELAFINLWPHWHFQYSPVVKTKLRLAQSKGKGTLADTAIRVWSVKSSHVVGHGIMKLGDQFLSPSPYLHNSQKIIKIVWDSFLWGWTGQKNTPCLC